MAIASLEKNTPRGTRVPCKAPSTLNFRPVNVVAGSTRTAPARNEVGEDPEAAERWPESPLFGRMTNSKDVMNRPSARETAYFDDSHTMRSRRDARMIDQDAVGPLHRSTVPPYL